MASHTGTGADAGKPSQVSVPESVPSVGIGRDGWVVEKIPNLHPTYANLTETGYWVYWKKREDGLYEWSPNYMFV